MMTTLVAVLAMGATLGAAEPQVEVFSGPQVGEKISGFLAFGISGSHKGEEVDYVTAFDGAPTVIVFVHDLQRSIVPLMRVVDRYGAQKKDALRALFVFLSDDRVESERRLPQVQRSLKLAAPVTLSVDGTEGPGNYGLNKKCLLTILVAKDNVVTANFALIQPGIADAPGVIAAMAKVIGDRNPPTAEQLETSGRGAMRGRRQGGRQMQTPPLDLSRFDLDTKEGLRDAVRALAAEVRALRADVTALRKPERPARGRAAGQRSTSRERTAGRELPGAAPTNPEIVRMLRSFIQRTNDDATVDRIIKEVEAYVRDDRDRKKEVVGGWTRVLHLEYGTAYAQKAGRAMLDRLKPQREGGGGS